MQALGQDGRVIHVHHWRDKRECQIIVIEMHCFTSLILYSVLSLAPSLYRRHEATMVDDTTEQIKAYIWKILRLALDVKGGSLRELNDPVGQASKFALYSIIIYTLRL
jgi:uncharacterized integral membrane protein